MTTILSPSSGLLTTNCCWNSCGPIASASSSPCRGMLTLMGSRPAENSSGERTSTTRLLPGSELETRTDMSSKVTDAILGLQLWWWRSLACCYWAATGRHRIHLAESVTGGQALRMFTWIIQASTWNSRPYLVKQNKFNKKNIAKLKLAKTGYSKAINSFKLFEQSRKLCWFSEIFIICILSHSDFVYMTLIRPV